MRLGGGGLEITLLQDGPVVQKNRIGNSGIYKNDCFSFTIDWLRWGFLNDENITALLGRKDQGVSGTLSKRAVPWGTLPKCKLPSEEPISLSSSYYAVERSQLPKETQSSVIKLQNAI